MSYSIQQSKRDHENWWAPGAMRFFGTRVSYATETVSGDGVLFVTSEQPPHGPRRYSVRFHTREDTHTVGKLCEHATRANAVAALKRVRMEQARERVKARQW